MARKSHDGAHSSLPFYLKLHAYFRERSLQHQLALPGSVASISDAFQRTLSIFTILFAPQYVLRTVFRRSFRIS